MSEETDHFHIPHQFPMRVLGKLLNQSDNCLICSINTEALRALGFENTLPAIWAVEIGAQVGAHILGSRNTTNHPVSGMLIRCTNLGPLIHSLQTTNLVCKTTLTSSSETGLYKFQSTLTDDNNEIRCDFSILTQNS
jgi:predicted hotdog family 3-hydroxylacyl-ACP dehydratase